MNLKCLFCRCDCLDKASGVFLYVEIVVTIIQSSANLRLTS